MSKKIVNTRNRQRIQAELMSFVDNGNGTAKIADVASNITEQGTRLDEVLLNGMQQGLVFTVDSNMTTKAGYDSYELGIDGMAGADNLNGFPMFSGFSLKFKAGATNTQGVVKVKISGTEYDLVKTFGTSVNAIASGEIKQGNIYDITFDGVRFSIFQNNINAYGLEAGTVLEGSRLAEALGVKKYGGLITQPGQKYADWAYYEPSMHEIFYCKANNTEVNPVTDKFEPFSNRKLLDRFERSFFKTYKSVTFSNAVQLKKGNVIGNYSAIQAVMEPNSTYLVFFDSYVYTHITTPAFLIGQGVSFRHSIPIRATADKMMTLVIVKNQATGSLEIENSDFDALNLTLFELTMILVKLA